MPVTQLGNSAVNVFMGSDGTIFHSCCWQPLQYLHVRGGVEVDFFCPGCVGHVTLPLRALPAIAVGERPAVQSRRPGPGLAAARA